MKKSSKLLTVLATSLLLGSAFSGYVHAAAKASAASADTVKVSLNKADAKSLMQVNGMNAYKAHAIVAYRNKNGAFKSAGDLEKVKGFKRMKPEALKAMTEQLVID